MALTVEDGTVVADADSYVSLADARAFATSRGFSLPLDDTEAEALLLRASDYLNGLEYVGTRYSAEQTLKWPRQYVYVDGFELDENTIPAQLWQAQVLSAVDLALGADPLAPSTDGRAIKRRKVDVIEVEYEAGIPGQLPVAVQRRVRHMLRGLLNTSYTVSR